jgi:hypothetical protein
MKRTAAIAMGASPIVTFGALQLMGASATLQWPAIASDFLSLTFWLTVVVMLCGGAFGGISYELLLRGGAIELPHRVQPDVGGRTYTHAPTETLIALGTIGRGLVGAAAALSVLLVASPATGYGALALSVTSGAAAPALIRLMRKQLVFAADVLGRVSRSEHLQPAPNAERIQSPTTGAVQAGQPV